MYQLNMVNGIKFKNIFKKPLADNKKSLYTITMKNLYTHLSITASKVEYRTPFIGSDNQSWSKATGFCVTEKIPRV